MRAFAWLVLLAGCDFVFRIDHFDHARDAATEPTGDADRDAPGMFACEPGSPILGGFQQGDTDPDERLDQVEMWFSRMVQGHYAIYVSKRSNVQSIYQTPVLAAFNNPGHENVDPGLTADGLHVFYLSDLNGANQPFETSRTLETDPFPGGATYYTVPETCEGLAPGADELTVYVNSYTGTLYEGTRATPGASFSWVSVGTGIWFPSVAGNGLSVYYHHEPEESGIYRQTRVAANVPFSNEEKVLATGTNPQISFDGTVLVYQSPEGFMRATCGMGN